VTESALATVGHLVTEFAEAVDAVLAALDSEEEETKPLARRRMDKELRDVESAIANIRAKLHVGAEPRGEAKS
jgi:hypothetical protein